MQLRGMTRPITRKQIGFSACTSGLDDGNEITRPEGRGERKRRGLVPKKSGGGRDSGVKKTRDLGLRPGMVAKCMAEDGTVLEGTVQKRTMKKRRKSNNNYDVRNNISGEVTEEVNFDWVVRYTEVKEWKAFSLDISMTILQGISSTEACT